MANPQASGYVRKDHVLYTCRYPIVYPCEEQRTSVQHTQVSKTDTPMPMNLCCEVRVEDSSILCNRVGSEDISIVSFGSYPICARKRSMKFDMVPVVLRRGLSVYV